MQTLCNYAWDQGRWRTPFLSWSNCYQGCPLTFKDTPFEFLKPPRYSYTSPLFKAPSMPMYVCNPGDLIGFVKWHQQQLDLSCSCSCNRLPLLHLDGWIVVHSSELGLNKLIVTATDVLVRWSWTSQDTRFSRLKELQKTSRLLYSSHPKILTNFSQPYIGSTGKTIDYTQVKSQEQLHSNQLLKWMHST